MHRREFISSGGNAAALLLGSIAADSASAGPGITGISAAQASVRAATIAAFAAIDWTAVTWKPIEATANQEQRKLRKRALQILESTSPKTYGELLEDSADISKQRGLKQRLEETFGNPVVQRLKMFGLFETVTSPLKPKFMMAVLAYRWRDTAEVKERPHIKMIGLAKKYLPPHKTAAYPIYLRKLGEKLVSKLYEESDLRNMKVDIVIPSPSVHGHIPRLVAQIRARPRPLLGGQEMTFVEFSEPDGSRIWEIPIPS